MPATHRYWLGQDAAIWLVVIGLVIISLGACRRGAPVIDTGPRPLDADGTISGTVSGPNGTTRVEGRAVEVVNVATGERMRTNTSNAGGFTFKVAPGRYRVELALLEGEILIRQPGVLNINRSDVDAHADFVIGVSRLSRPRFSPPLRAAGGLGAPIA